MTTGQVGSAITLSSGAESKGEKLPGALIVGASKSGTTTLFDYLGRHPQVYPSPIKEPSFFSFSTDRPIPSSWLSMCGFFRNIRRRELYRFLARCGFSHKTGTRRLDPFAMPAGAIPSDLRWDEALPYYQSLFAGARHDQICMEASTDYTRWPQIPEAPSRIASMLPDVKLIYMMRHPIDRAYSHFVHNVVGAPPEWTWRGKALLRPSDVTFEAYIEEDPMCLDSSHYMKQIEQYLEYFPRERFLFLFLDELEEAPRSVLRRAFEFLEIEDRSEALTEDPIRSNAATSKEDRIVQRWAIRPLYRNRVMRSVLPVVPGRLRRYAEDLMVRSPHGRRMRAACRLQPMRPETRRALIERFREPNRRLGEFLGVDLSHWDR